MSKTKTNDGLERVVLTEALRRLKIKYPWAPVNALRQAVRDGRVPSIRSPGTLAGQKRARYYVTVSDLESALTTN